MPAQAGIQETGSFLDASLRWHDRDLVKGNLMKPQQDVEKGLIELTQALLKEGGELHAERQISLHSSLQNNLGLDSLGRAELLSRIEKKWKIQLPDQLLVEAETLKDLLTAIENAQPRESGSKPSTQKRSSGTLEAKQQPLEWAKLAKAETLLEVLLAHAHKAPDQPYIYFQNDSGGEDILTYGQLLSRAEQVASSLQQRGLKPGETVALMLPTQLEFFYAFFGILLASGIPIPIYPPLRPHLLESYAKQEANILRNAEIRFLFTFHQAETLSRLLQSFVPSLQEVLTVEGLLKAPNLKPAPNTVKKDDLALIQYTSGSTGNPKGVALSHQNLLANIRAFGKAAEISSEDIAVSWLPLYHDFGLIGLVLGTLYYGIPLILMSPLSFLSRPEKWLWAIHYHRATLSAAPNFAYELCVRKIDPESIEGLDLSSWRIAANGAENIYPKTYERFVQKFKAYGFHPEAFLPVYGLAESTVGLALSPLHRLPRIDVIDRQALEEEKRARPLGKASSTQEKLEIISCGKPLPGHALRIVDAHHRELPERFVGHLEFQGPSVMQGYYNNPAATKAIEHQGWWASGDFAYLADGEVFITGRQKDIIIKAGRNIYPTVIEEQVSDLPGIRRGCVIAFSVSDKEKGTERIIIVAETSLKDPTKKEALRTHMTETLVTALDLAPDQIILVPPRTVPKTSSGKLQRSTCKAMYLEGKLRYAPAWMQLTKISLKSFFFNTVSFSKRVLKFLYTLYLAVLIGLLALPFWLSIKLLSSQKASRLSKQAANCLRFLSGCSMKIEGLANLTKEKPVIYVANHASYVDAIFLMCLLPAETRFVGKKELFSVPFLRGLLLKLKVIPINRLDFMQGLAQTKNLELMLVKGEAILIFPEGTFSYAAGLRPFKLGAFKIAAATKTPICPIALQGTRQILRGTSFLLRPGKVKCTIGEPIYPKGDEWQDIMHLKNEVRNFLSTNCGELSLDFSHQQ